MTLTAPKSRQGKFVLVLAFLAALVAVSAVLVWANTAQAQLPGGTTAELNQSPDGPGPVAPGGAVSYDAVATTTATIPVGDVLVLEIEIPANLTSPVVSCTAGETVMETLGGDATCGWDNAVAGTYTTTLSGTAGGSLPVPAAEVCSVAIAVDDCDGATGADVQAAVDATNDTGLLTMSAPVTVTDATNFPGIGHTFIFTLAAGVTCQSDDGTLGGNNVECTGADVTIGNVGVSAGCTVTAGPTVAVPSLANATTVSVTIDGGTGIEGDCTVTLDTKFVGPCEDCAADDFDFTSVIATKTFAAPAGEIRHLDEADAASEDAAGTTDSDPLEDWCDNAAGTCGILLPQDDSDDATGSFHQACIINTTLTHAADSLNITWDIVAVSGSPLPTPVSITEVAGPVTGEPCVRWSTGFTGVQNITAVYDNGVGLAVTYYWDGYCVELGSCTAVNDNDDASGAADDPAPVPLPLIKQWNDIEDTKIIDADGNVGDLLTSNTVDLADWTNRDCSSDPVAPGPTPPGTNFGFCDNTNVDSLTMLVEATGVIQSTQLFLIAPPVSFIEYVTGSHDDLGGSYDGPIDGVSQTYTISGDCGSVRLENPQTGETIILSNSAVGDGVHDAPPAGADDYVSPAAVVNPYATAQILSSDKGVGFSFVPNSTGANATIAGEANCGNGDTICIGITTVEANLFDSGPLQAVAQEDVCVVYNVGPPTSKTPTLAWAGQRVVLSHNWGFTGDAGSLVCPFDLGTELPLNFYVLYSVQAGPGSFTAALQGSALDVSQTGQDVIVEVDATTCTSNVIFENQDQAQNDIIAYVVDGIDLSTASPLSQQVPFVIYYMKFEDATLTLVPGERANHNSGAFDPNGPFDSSGDVDSMSDVNVSADVLARLRVRGWVTTTNCPVRDSGTGANGEFLPANRCIFPDDWRFKAGGGVGDSLNDPAAVAGFAEESRPNFDSDGDGIINAWDAPMPQALASFGLVGSGFLRGADKDDIYAPATNNNPLYATNIPASTFISPINADLSGYQWNSFGVGSKSGPYDFWNDLADNGPEVLSCASDCSGAGDPGVPTGGYLMTKVYTDNHGEAMTWINGDAHLTFDDCTTSAAAAGHMIVLLSGYYCESGDGVGSSTLSASVDYPDKRKHFAIQAEDVTIDWTWGGIKEVTIEAGADANGQFNYVVFHVTDRDGFCNSSTSLHPVLGERVTFVIDSPNGIIIANENGDAVALAGSWTTKTADVTTFDTGANATLTQPVVAAGECQAWIHITESLLNPVNVIVTAFDPEGTVTFDKIINPIPDPTPEPTPEPPPATQQNLWADIDCSGSVNPVDALKMLRADAGKDITQTAPCPLPSTDLDVMFENLTENEKWGDADCSGELNPVDSLKVLRFDAGLFSIQKEPCPGIGAEVLIPQQ